MNIAVIDIGSNTINLLIASINENNWTKLYEETIPAQLAKGGIDKNIISPEAIQRGFEAIKSHLNNAKKHKCQEVLAFATAAVRDANNRDEFTELIKNELELDIKVIDGEREAELICRGIIASQSLSDGKNLIMDIGGGSTEFIIIENESILYKRSFRLGVTRLLEKFQPSDPISQGDVSTINQHFDKELKELADLISKYKIHSLIGASGSFDSLAEMNAAINNSRISDVKNSISISNYHQLAKMIIEMNINERARIKGLASYRVETISMAILLINYILKLSEYKKITQSSYALKEGVVSSTRSMH